MENINFLISFVLLIPFILLLAGKDATSYQLKDKGKDTQLTKKRINRWHRDGVALFIIFVFVLILYTGLIWETILLSLLLRLTLFDPFFNKWSSLSTSHLGSTAFWDKIFVKIFGINGAIKKSIVFGILSVLFVLYKLFI